MIEKNEIINELLNIICKATNPDCANSIFGYYVEHKDNNKCIYNLFAESFLSVHVYSANIATVPSELFAKFQTSFYTSPEDAAIKALGIE